MIFQKARSRFTLGSSTKSERANPRGRRGLPPTRAESRRMRPTSDAFGRSAISQHRARHPLKLGMQEREPRLRVRLQRSSMGIRTLYSTKRPRGCLIVSREFVNCVDRRSVLTYFTHELLGCVSTVCDIPYWLRSVRFSLSICLISVEYSGVDNASSAGVEVASTQRVILSRLSVRSARINRCLRC